MQQLLQAQAQQQQQQQLASSRSVLLLYLLISTQSVSSSLDHWLMRYSVSAMLGPIHVTRSSLFEARITSLPGNFELIKRKSWTCFWRCEEVDDKSTTLWTSCNKPANKSETSWQQVVSCCITVMWIGYQWACHLIKAVF